MDRKEFDAGAVPRPDFLKHLEADARFDFASLIHCAASYSR
jgi:hypothetical protein